MTQPRELLADVYEAYRAESRFDHLRRDGIILVPGMGSSRPRIFIVGEAPGALENTLRAPFRGPSGRVLRSLMKDVAGLNQDDLFLTNVVKYHPLGNRPVTHAEVEASLPYLRREYAAVGAPAVLVAVGGVAWKSLAPESHANARIIRIAGDPVTIAGGKALWPMVQPSYAFNVPDFKEKIEKHWERFGNWFREEFGQ